MKQLILLLFATALLFSSYIPLSKEISINPNLPPNTYWKKGIATVKIKNRTKATQYVNIANQIIRLEKGKRIKFEMPCGEYFVSTGKNEEQFHSYYFYGKQINTITLY